MGRRGRVIKGNEHWLCHGAGALAVVGIIQRWGLGGRSRGKSWPGDINANTYSEETLCQIERSI